MLQYSILFKHKLGHRGARGRALPTYLPTVRQLPSHTLHTNKQAPRSPPHTVCNTPHLPHTPPPHSLTYRCLWMKILDVCGTYVLVHACVHFCASRFVKKTKLASLTFGTERRGLATHARWSAARTSVSCREQCWAY